jgi:hypothetical protein
LTFPPICSIFVPHVARPLHPRKGLDAGHAEGVGRGGDGAGAGVDRGGRAGRGAQRRCGPEVLAPGPGRPAVGVAVRAGAGGWAGREGQAASPPSPPKPALYAPWEETGQSEAEWTRQKRAGSRAYNAYDVIEKVIDNLDSGSEQDRLIIELSERIETDADEALFDSDAPIAAVIADICAALDFEPNWHRVDEDDWTLAPADLARLRSGRFAPVSAFEAAIPPPDPSAQSPPPWPG